MERKKGHLTKSIARINDSLVWIKVVGIGNAGVGKTCLIKHFCESKFNQGYQPTIGVDYGFKIQNVQGTDLRVHLWDLSGNPDYLDVRNELYTGTDAVFLTYDVTNEESFQALDMWLKEYQKYGPSDVDIVLIGNKVDAKTKRVVPTTDGRKWAMTHKISYSETSSSTGEGVEKMFDDLLSAVIKRKKIISSHS